MKRAFFVGVVSLLMLIGTVASACWFTALNFDKAYIAKVNTKVTFTSSGTIESVVCTPAGTQDLPAQIWIKLQPRNEQGAPAITEAILQYKKLPDGTWTTFKHLRSLSWTLDFSQPVQLFGPNIFDPPGAKTNDQYLIRLWFTDGLFENADLDVNTPEGGDTVWRNQWATKIIVGKRRPGL